MEGKMVDLNPATNYFGRTYTVEEAGVIQKRLLKTMPTGSTWYWADSRTGNEVVDTRIYGKRDGPNQLNKTEE